MTYYTNGFNFYKCNKSNINFINIMNFINTKYNLIYFIYCCKF